MADTLSPQIAALLLQQQRRQDDPAERSRRYGQLLMQQGMSTTPVQSPLEGLARALQGGLGGLFEGMAEREQKGKEQATIGGLSDYAKATDDAGRNAALAQILKGDATMVAPFLMQQISDQRALGQAQRGLTAMPTIGGGVPGAGGGAPAQPGQPLTIDMTPLPAGQIPQGGGFANNVGNIRATPNVSFPGQGAPQNGFMTFGTPQEGVNAARANLGAYVQQNPQITVAQAIAKWAPPSENNTQQYISQVAEGTGINPGMPLAEVLRDPAVAAQLLDAITRKEKGGLPPGVTADTFMTATGSAPGAPQVAQGSAQGPAAAPFAPVAPPATVSRETSSTPEISPQALELQRQAQELGKVGTVEAFTQARALQAKALEAQAAYVQERAKTADQRTYDQGRTADQRAFEQAEYDRRQSTKDPTAEQALSAGFADRMVNSAGLITQFAQAGTNAADRLKAAIPFGLGNSALSPEYQRYRQARDDFINAQLRRESGAAIAESEYANADRQYFPQPGDSPDVIAQKERNRQLAVEGMIRNAGPNYKQSPLVTAPMPGAAPPSSSAPPAGTIMDGYRFKGGDPSRQENWERAQ